MSAKHYTWPILIIFLCLANGVMTVYAEDDQTLFHFESMPQGAYFTIQSDNEDSSYHGQTNEAVKKGRLWESLRVKGLKTVSFMLGGEKLQGRMPWPLPPGPRRILADFNKKQITYGYDLPDHVYWLWYVLQDKDKTQKALISMSTEQIAELHNSISSKSYADPWEWDAYGGWSGFRNVESLSNAFEKEFGLIDWNGEGIVLGVRNYGGSWHEECIWDFQDGLYCFVVKTTAGAEYLIPGAHVRIAADDAFGASAVELLEPKTRSAQERDISFVQAMLTHLGYYKAEIDGLYGPKTRQAIIDFEKQRSDKASEGRVTDELIANLQALLESN